MGDDERRPADDEEFEDQLRGADEDEFEDLEADEEGFDEAEPGDEDIRARDTTTGRPDHSPSSPERQKGPGY